MDFRQIENTIRISESKSICEASEELYITQSALNQQLIRLEDELGVKLFQRSKAGVSPTEAGREYLKYAKKLISVKKEMMSVLSDFAACKTGTVRIGMPVIRGVEMFTHIFPAFHEKYPLIRLEPIEISYAQRFQKISSGELDLAFITLTQEDRTGDEFYPILDEEIYLAVPKKHERLEELKQYKEIALSLVKNESFVMINKGTSLRKLASNLFREAGYYPRIIMETSNYQTIASIVSYGAALSVVPQNNMVDASGVEYLPLKGRPFRTFCAIHKKGAYMSQPVRDFLDMSTEYWRQKA